MQKIAWYCLLAWVALLGANLDFGSFQLRPADILVVPLGVFAIARSLHAPVSPAVIRIGVFAGLFLTLGHLVAALNRGTITEWMLIKRDLGLITMLLCVLAISAIVRSWEQFKSLTVAFVAGGSLLNLLGLILIPTGLTMYGTLRYKGFNPDPNYWSGYLSTVAVFQFALLIFGGKRIIPVRPLYQWINFFLLTLGIVISESRGSMIATLAGILCCFAFASRRARFTIAALVCLSAIPVWMLLTSFGASEHLLEPSGFSSRTEINHIAWEMYSSSPASLMFGSGVGAFLAKAPSLGLTNETGLTNGVHNTYLWLLVDGGPLLLLAFLWVVSTSAVSMLQGRNLDGIRALALGGFCALISCLVQFLAVEGSFQREFWFLLGFSAVLHRFVATAKTGRLVIVANALQPNLRSSP